MLIKAIECKDCGDIIYPRTHGDFRRCSCGAVEVSGGTTYFKHFTIPGAQYEIKKIDVNISLDKLYEDWYNMKDKYGLIKPKKSIFDRSKNGTVRKSL